MKNLVSRLLVIILAPIIFVSCQKYSNLDYSVEKDNRMQDQSKISIYTQFKKLNNPYSVENMIKAYAEIKKKDFQTAKSLSGIKATHYYVKFFPKDSLEHEKLLADSTLNLYPYPLDVEFPEGYNLSEYRDPDNLPGEYPHYYASIPVDKKISNVRYEIIENLFIPDENKISKNHVNQSIVKADLKEVTVKALVNKSLELTGNDKELLDNQRVSVMSANYVPSGRIRVLDTRLNQLIGLEGIRIEARRWFTTHVGYTNSEGYYSVDGDFERPANYSMWYATGQFSVRPHLISTTMMYNGPKQSGSWDLDLTSGMYMFGAHIFRGAYRYYYKNIGGLSRPVIPGPNRQIYVAVDDVKSWSGRNWIVFPDIQIARYKSAGIEYSSDEVFSTTCHETAHTAHVNIMNAGPIQYSQVEGIIQESWCVGVEWFITGMEYKERGINNYGDFNYSAGYFQPQFPNEHAYQYWNRNDYSNEYTSLFIDIIDNYNQVGQTFSFSRVGVVDDQVNGYTLPYIEQSFLKHVYGRASLSEKLKENKPFGSQVTDQQIDLLISFF